MSLSDKAAMLDRMARLDNPARQLYLAAQGIREEYGHPGLDPLHLVAAAARSTPVMPGILAVFGDYRIPLDSPAIRKAMTAVPPSTARVQGGDTRASMEVYNEDFNRLITILVEKYKQSTIIAAAMLDNPDRPGPWELSVEMVREALALQDSSSIQQLHVLVLRARRD